MDEARFIKIYNTAIKFTRKFTFTEMLYRIYLCMRTYQEISNDISKMKF